MANFIKWLFGIKDPTPEERLKKVQELCKDPKQNTDSMQYDNKEGDNCTPMQ